LPLDEEQYDALTKLPLRKLSGIYFRQTSPARQPFELATHAPAGARWHRKGDPWPAYAGDTELGVMLEQTRHTALEAGNEVLPIRRVSELHLDCLPVVDLANAMALDVLGLVPDDLRGDSTVEFCRDLAAATWAGQPAAAGLLTPSTPLSGGKVLVIKPEAFGTIDVGRQELVQLLPVKQADP
jgi:RES domain-containing protein